MGTLLPPAALVRRIRASPDEAVFVSPARAQRSARHGSRAGPLSTDHREWCGSRELSGLIRCPMKLDSTVARINFHSANIVCRALRDGMRASPNQRRKSSGLVSTALQSLPAHARMFLSIRVPAVKSLAPAAAKLAKFTFPFTPRPGCYESSRQAGVRASA